MLSSSSPFLSDTGSDENCEQTAELRMENARLMQANSELTEQLASLRAQFDRAVSVASSVDDLASKMATLESESAKLKNENQDLGNRLRIALDRNLELEQTVSSLSTPNFTQKAEVTRLESQIKALKEQCDGERSEMTAMKREKEMREKELASIFSTAEEYFGCSVDSSHTLIHCLKQDGTKSSQHLSEQVAKLRKKLRRARRHSESLSEIKSSFREELDDINGILDQKGAEFAKRVEDLESRNSEQFRQIGELTREKEQLVREVAEKNSQLRMLSLSSDERQGKECQRLTGQLSETTERLAVVMKENKDLKKKLYKISFRGKTLEKKSMALEATIRSMKAKKEQLRLELERTSNVVAQSEVRTKEIQGFLDRSRDEVAQKAKEIERLNEECVKLETEMKKKSRYCTELERDKEDLTQQIQKEGLARQQLENRVQSEQDKQTSLEKALYETTQKLRDALKPVDTTDLVPLSVWISESLPSELQNEITEVAKDITIQLPTKIQKCLAIIPKWYQVRCDDLEKQLAKEKDEVTVLQSRIATLTEFLKQVVPDIKINYDLLIADELTRSVFGEAILNKDKEVERARKARKDLETRIHNFCLTVNVENIEDIQDELDNRELAIKRLSKKCKQEKQRNDQLTQQLSETQAQLAEHHKTREDVESENAEIRKRICESTEQIESLNGEIEKLKQTIRDAQAQRESMADENTNLHDLVESLKHKKSRLRRQIQSIQGMIEQVEATFKQKVKKLKDACESRVVRIREEANTKTTQLEAVIRELSEKSARLEQTNGELAAKNNELSLKVQRLETRAGAFQLEFERNRRAIESQMNAKIQYTESEYRAQIADLQAENAAFRSRIAATISNQLGGFTDGVKISESNFESALQAIKRKLDCFTTRENALRSALNLQPLDSLEDAVVSLTRRRHRRY